MNFCKLAILTALFLLMVCLVFSCAMSDSNSDSDDDNDDETGDDDSAPEGVWVDEATGLMWENTEMVGYDQHAWVPDVQESAYCDSLNALQAGGFNDWRVPTISELRTLVRGCGSSETGGTCGVTDQCLDSGCWSYDACETCEDDAGPSNGAYWPAGLMGLPTWYWSLSKVANDELGVWGVDFESGEIHSEAVDVGGYAIRCVRG